MCVHIATALDLAHFANKNTLCMQKYAYEKVFSFHIGTKDNCDTDSYTAYTMSSSGLSREEEEEVRKA